MKIIFIWYEGRDGRERTHTTHTLKRIPPVGDGIALGDDNIPIMDVTRVLWVYDNDCSWHVEIYLKR